MNEADTRAELIDPQLKQAGWGVIEDALIKREFYITDGRIQKNGKRDDRLKADYVLIYRGQKLAIVEAKSDEKPVSAGVAQAKDYAGKLCLDWTYSANGKKIYEINMKEAREGEVSQFPAPQELWDRTFAKQNKWRDKFQDVPLKLRYEHTLRYYQEVAVNRTLNAIAENKKRILLTLATGTGKTSIAFHIVWKLFQSKWTLQADGARSPRILFLTDRNILASQALREFKSFAAFKDEDNALIRVSSDEIANKKRPPTNASVFFTIFQTFMTEKNERITYTEYPSDFFDVVIIDECHRGGANEESSWRGILDYFAPAVHIGLTATPKRNENIDTYDYFGEPVYIYSLKQGIQDGFLTPYKVRRVSTTADKYIYTDDDEVLMGEPEHDREYASAEHNRKIEIRKREEKRVEILLREINHDEKTIIFCATQRHAGMIRDIVNQMSSSDEPNYCVRITSEDGKIGDDDLRTFQDNDKLVPTIITTSRKLSTGVDARNLRNIVLLRPIRSMIEFKQIIGRGTRVYEGKSHFTIYDYEDAYQLFFDPAWDGEAVEVEKIKGENGKEKAAPPQESKTQDEKIKNTSASKSEMIQIHLADGKTRQIQYMIDTLYYNANGDMVSAEEFVKELYNQISLKKFFKDENELRHFWSNPQTRAALLRKLNNVGFGMAQLEKIQELINAQNSDILDVLEYIAYANPPCSRQERVKSKKDNIYAFLKPKHHEFIDFVLEHYIKKGVAELAEDRLSELAKLKYGSVFDAQDQLGNANLMRQSYFDCQRQLYAETLAG